MAKSTTPSFITQIPFKADTKDLSILKKRFWVAKQQYNALLGETLKRLRKMKQDQMYKQAINLYKQKGEKPKAKQIFKNLSEQYSYREYDLYAYTKQWNTKHNPLSIGSKISQKLAKRAFQAVEEYKAKKRGIPRFKGIRGINSIEDSGLDNIRIKNNTLHYLGLKIPLLCNEKDPIHYHGLNSRIKYIRIVKRQFNTKTRYFAQLINEGTPWKKSQHITKHNTIGLDIGPQTIAIVNPQEKKASIQVFADEIKQQKAKKTALQRKLSRQLRANNPACYKKDTWEKKDKNWIKKQGTSIKGKRLQTRSKSLKKTFCQLADLQRKQASFRKAQHGKLINEILKQGSYIKTEKLRYKSFQALYGKSVGLRAPGTFIKLLKRKAENAGGGVEEINTYKTKLSQTCQCGQVTKKPLSQRWHTCKCGIKTQRDLYSAYLACFVENNTLIADKAQKAWSGMDIALRTAMRKIKHSSSKALPTSLGLTGSERVVCNVS